MANLKATGYTNNFNSPLWPRHLATWNFRYQKSVRWQKKMFFFSYSNTRKQRSSLTKKQLPDFTEIFSGLPVLRIFQLFLNASSFQLFLKLSNIFLFINLKFFSWYFNCRQASTQIKAKENCSVETRFWDYYSLLDFYRLLRIPCIFHIASFSYGSWFVEIFRNYLRKNWNKRSIPVFRRYFFPSFFFIWRIQNYILYCSISIFREHQLLHKLNIGVKCKKSMTCITLNARFCYLKVH